MSDNFWNRVLDLLDRQGISRKEFAHKIGISYSSIHNRATLNSIPSTDIALRIAYELHTSIEYLVYGSENFLNCFIIDMDISKNFIFKEKNSVEDKKADLIEKFNSFDLGERGGGEQLIIDYRAISPTEYDVMALGNGPRLKEDDINDDIKIRFFRLTFAEGTKFNVAEYITPESICRVAKLFI